MKKIVIFGAGKIGRSFIGQLFGRSGYEVVFVDIWEQGISELNRRRKYNIIIKGDREEKITIKNVRGVLASDKEKVAEELSKADIAATSVGSNALPGVIPLVAMGLRKRYLKDKNLALDIILAENMRDASGYFEKSLYGILGKEYPLKRLVGLIETSIGKMVPIMLKKDLKEDILQVFAEPYNNLILDRKAFKNPVPGIKGLSPKENIKAWVDRKLFVHNLGHAVISYLGYLYNNNFIYLYEALAVKELRQQTRMTMLQSAKILLKEYPGEFTIEALEEHIDDLLYRFSNKALGDTIYRVGMDLQRKLGPEDRLAGAVMLGIKHNMDVDMILYSLVCAFYFRATDESGKMFEGDIAFVSNYFNKGIKYVLTKLCGFDEKKHISIITTCINLSEEIAEKFNIGRT